MWLDMDLFILKRCDALYRVHGPSDGAEREVKVMESLGRPVFTKLLHLKEWMHEED